MNLIDKSKPIPKYYQIKEAIQHEIKQYDLQPGDKLPTEAWLAEHFEVSRVTVRKALDELLHDGVICRPRGKCPEIAQTKSHRYNRLYGLYSELKRMGLEHTSHILKLEHTTADETEAGKLHIHPGDPVIFIQRLHHVEREPLALQRLWLNAENCSGVDLSKVENGSLYRQLEDAGKKIWEASQTISARRPTAEECRLLEIETGSPILLMQRTTFLEDRSVIEYVETSYVAYKYNISMTLYP